MPQIQEDYMDLIEDFRQQHMLAPKDETEAQSDSGTEKGVDFEFDNRSDNSFEDLGSEVYELQFKKQISDDKFEEFSNEEINQAPNRIVTGGLNFQDLVQA